MVGELAALNGILQRRRALFLLPMKALVNDKYQEFVRKYAALGIARSAPPATSTTDIGALMPASTTSADGTTRSARRSRSAPPHILTRSEIVVDEVQMIVDPSRGGTSSSCSSAAGATRARLGAADDRAVSGHRDTNGLEAGSTRACCAAQQAARATRRGRAATRRQLPLPGTDGEAPRARALHQPQYVRAPARNWVIPLVESSSTPASR